MINEAENVVLVRQEDVACRYAISLSNLCWLHELIITHRAPSNPRVWLSTYSQPAQSGTKWKPSQYLVRVYQPCVLGTIPKFAR